MKILVCDYTGTSAQWLKQCAVKENFEVVATITPATDENQLMKLLKENFWEYLLIFEKGMRNEFEKIIKALNLPKNRIVYALDGESWQNHNEATLALLNPNGNAKECYRASSFNVARNLNYFMSVTTEDGFHYVGTSKDNFVIRDMYLDSINFNRDEMKLFQALAKMFYHIDDSNGWFLDLGANIGTTGIYFTKRFAPNLKLLAFEPDAENFKMLRTNLILNDAEKNSVAENLGLGDEETELIMYRDIYNPGHNGFFADNRATKVSEKVKITTLDKYFAEKKISPKDVKYIWIDTEGFEAKVLLGAKNILTENPAPIFMEFNPYHWQSTGCYEKIMELLKKLYVGYIWILKAMQTKQIEVQPIENLWKFQKSRYGTGGLGDILLIHKI